MAKVLEEREPLTEQEVWNYLTDHVKAEEKQWGVNDYYANCARKNREKKMEQYRNGEVVCVYVQHYVDSYGNGCGDFEDKLYSDGHVETCYYGYLD